MHCPHCGLLIPDTSGHCAHCGAYKLMSRKDLTIKLLTFTLLPVLCALVAFWILRHVPGNTAFVAVLFECAASLYLVAKVRQREMLPGAIWRLEKNGQIIDLRAEG